MAETLCWPREQILLLLKSFGGQMKQILCFLICMVVSSAGLAANNTYSLNLSITLDGQEAFWMEGREFEAGREYMMINGAEKQKYMLEMTITEEPKNVILMSFKINEIFNSVGGVVGLVQGTPKMIANPKLKTMSGIEVSTIIAYEGKESFSIKATPTLLL